VWSTGEGSVAMTGRCRRASCSATATSRVRIVFSENHTGGVTGPLIVSESIWGTAWSALTVFHTCSSCELGYRREVVTLAGCSLPALSVQFRTARSGNFVAIVAAPELTAV
jgi:hypothetical protein